MSIHERFKQECGPEQLEFDIETTPDNLEHEYKALHAFAWMVVTPSKYSQAQLEVHEYGPSTALADIDLHTKSPLPKQTE